LNIIKVNGIETISYLTPAILSVLKNLNLEPFIEMESKYYGTKTVSFYFNFRNNFKVTFIVSGSSYTNIRNLKYLINQKKLPTNFHYLFINGLKNTLVEYLGVLYTIKVEDLFINSSSTNDYDIKLEPL
jgi:hypothetical protein